MNKLILFVLGFYLVTLLPYNSIAQENYRYPQLEEKITSFRIPLPNKKSIKYIYLDDDKDPDGLKATLVNGTKVLWIDDDDDMVKGDLEGDMDNDCLLIDLNNDGKYGSELDLIIDYIDDDNDGKADYQTIVDNGKKDYNGKWKSHYIWFVDNDNDGVFGYINGDNFKFEGWDHSGLANFYTDYNGKSTMLKVHITTWDVEDLEFSWENPFLFYDEDNDGLTEMAIRMVDEPVENNKENRAWQYSHNISLVQMTFDLDNDNRAGNELDFDMSLKFSGKGFDYTSEKHPFNNKKVLQEASSYFDDHRWREINELVYPDHSAAFDLTFNSGEWKECWFVFDEDDDCNRWERVEFYDPKDPFKIGAKNGGLDHNPQADASGDRGEWDLDFSGKGQLYISPLDGKLHLYGAETGYWRIDQNTLFYQGWQGWRGPNLQPESQTLSEPARFATIKYEDTNSNGFFDKISYDMDGDHKFESVFSAVDFGLSDSAEIINISKFTFKDYHDLYSKMANDMFNKAISTVKFAEEKGLNTNWYSFLKNPKSIREKYHNGFWLNYYLYEDLKAAFGRKKKNLKKIMESYYSSNWSLSQDNNDTELKINKMISPESTVTKNHAGKDFNKLKHTWKAQWITHPTESTLDYGVFLFRHSFKLDHKPENFNIFVSADNRYRLYVNGESVCFGPSIGDLTHQRYETIDIANWLNEGDNVLAAEVVNFGEYKNVSQLSFQTAFILQGDSSNGIDINTGSADWKVTKNKAYTAIPFTSEMLNAYYAAGPCDRVDAALYPWGWNQGDYDDSSWVEPKKAVTEFAVGSGFLYGGAWFLVPRTIPLMEEKYEPFGKVARTKGIQADDSFIKGDQPLVIPKNSKVSILVDQAHHTTGFPELTYSKGKDSKIKITYAEALIKDVDSLEKTTDGNLISVDLKGNRNEVEGKSILGYYDIIIPDGGNNRFFKPLARRTYRFIELEIETKEEELVLEKYHGVYTGYPFEEKARFNTDDQLLTKIWETSWRTLRNSAEENFFDPYYEQLQYIGDTRIEALVSIYVSGDDRLMRKALKQFDDSRIPEGLTQSRYPSNIVQVIPTYSLLWVDMVHDYFMYRDDPEFLHQFIPGIKSVMDWFISKVDETGMVTDLEWWNFTDWSAEFPNGIPPGADDGYSANVSLQLVKSLQNASELYGYFEMDHESASYKMLAEQIKKSVLQQCYDSEKGLIAETPEKTLYSQHTNIFGIITDTFDKEDQAQVMQKILEDDSLIPATIYFKFYLFRALQKAGLGNRYLDLLGPWKTMIDNGMTTFGETDINPRSECHAWSASPNFDFLHTVAGIYPAEPSFRSVIIEPNLGKLENLEVEMPHPKGNIKASFQISGNTMNAVISLPEGTTGVFKWNGRSVKLTDGEQNISL
ncbi:MAG: alpha-L-rhamnosidase N-terminal domain-containing protein [Bacteroidota bacterium]